MFGTGIGHNLFVQPASSSLLRVPDGFHVKSNVIRAIGVRRRHRLRYYVIRDVFDIYKYIDAIDLRYYVIRDLTYLT